MKAPIVALTLTGILCLSSTAFGAATDQKDPCEADASRFCKDALPDEGRIAACLKANHAKLSSGCKTSFDKRMKGQD